MLCPTASIQIPRQQILIPHFPAILTTPANWKAELMVRSMEMRSPVVKLVPVVLVNAGIVGEVVGEVVRARIGSRVNPVVQLARQLSDRRAIRFSLL